MNQQDKDQPDALTMYTANESSSLIGKAMGNFISVKNGMSVASHHSIMQASVAHGKSIMMNSAEGSGARKGLEDGKSKQCVIMTTLCLITFGANLAYSAVVSIFPSTMQTHNLGSIWTSFVIAGYPLGQSLMSGTVTNLLNGRGRKITLMIGMLAQCIAIVIFGYSDKFSEKAPYNYIMFAVLFVSRFVQGFGNGCINASSSSIIAFNFADNMGTLLGIQNLFTQMGMLLGGVIGGKAKHYIGYTWVYNCNAILLAILLAITIIFFPSDPPPKQSLDQENSGGKSDISCFTLLKRFNQFSIGCVIALCLFSWCMYESILQPTLVDYVGASPGDVGVIQALQGVTFLLAYFPQSIIPDRKKNFNKIMLFGAILFVISLFLQGPFIGMPVGMTPNSLELDWILAGLAIGGVGGAFITPYGMPALAENLEGVFPADKDGEVKNAMGSLLSLCFGLGNLIGCILGGVINQIAASKDCLRFDSSSKTIQFTEMKKLMGLKKGGVVTQESMIEYYSKNTDKIQKYNAPHAAALKAACAGAASTSKACTTAKEHFEKVSLPTSWCDIKYMWTNSIATFKLANLKDATLPDLTVVLPHKGLTTAQQPAYEALHCWKVCSGVKYSPTVNVPVTNLGWQWTYTVGFICAILLTAVQIISVCCCQQKKKKRGDNGKYTELEQRTSVNLDD